jgi:hypothetical protein
MASTYEKVTEYRKKNGNLVPVYPATSTDNVIDTDGATLLSSKLTAMQADIDGKSDAGHKHNASDINAGTLEAARIPNLDASKITTGTISIDRLPAGALERLVVVADQAARFALTSSQVQLGDTVKQTDTGLMYYVIDTSKLSSAAGYEEYTAGAATSVPWSGVTGKPTTYVPSTHSHNSSEVTSLTGYSKPSSTSAITTSDTLNSAVGKLEKALDGKAATSHGTHVTYSTDTPRAVGTASAGSAATVARSDHAHDLPDSGVSSGSYGEDGATRTLAYYGTVKIPYLTVDGKGRITNASTKELTLPGPTNTVTQSPAQASDTGEFPLLLKRNATETAITDGVKFKPGVTVNPVTGVLTAPTFNGELNGTAEKATKDGSGNTITATYLTAVGSTPSANTLQVTKNGTASNVGLPTWAGYGTSLPSASAIAAMPDGACFILYES